MALRKIPESRELAARRLPDGLRDETSAYLASGPLSPDGRSNLGRFVSFALSEATAGRPIDTEQEARWKQLGLLP